MIGNVRDMTTKEVLKSGDEEEASEIREALVEAEEEFARGEGIEEEEMRRRFGL